MSSPRTEEKVRDIQAEAPRRADAVRNREKVIAAAEQVFAEHGIEAGIPEIAERAGVGKGTVYRNFESKDELVSAILARRLDRFSEDIAEALEREDSGAAFRDVLRHSAARANALSFPTSISRAGRTVELDEAKARTTALMDRLIRKARKEGSIRRDAKADEVWVMFGGVCRNLADAGENDPAVWRRHADLVADAFRPVSR